jgi:hypothetical protein
MSELGWNPTRAAVVKMYLPFTLFPEENHSMKSVWARSLCRLLMVLTFWAPIQYAQAGMIGTEQVVAAASQADRGMVLEFLGRAEVVNQLQSMGIDPATAKDRVAAMTDHEVQQVANRIQTAPAGGDTLGVVLLLLIVGAVVWWVWFRR